MAKYDDKEYGVPTNPLYELKPHQKINPIYYQDEETTGSRRFAILRTTDNGAYVRGNMLYYKLHGVELYTEIDNIIFVDLDEEIVTIRSNQQVTEQIAPSDDPEERQYIFLLSNNDDLYEWVSLIGRTEAYEWIKSNIDIYEFDPDNSIVLTENVAFKDALSITKFIKYLKNASIFEDDFDIDYYRTGETDDGTEL